MGQYQETHRDGGMSSWYKQWWSSCSADIWAWLVLQHLVKSTQTLWPAPSADLRPPSSSHCRSAQMAVSLSQTVQMILAVSVVTAYAAFAGRNKTKIIWIKRELWVFLPVVDASHFYVQAWTLCCFNSLIRFQTLGGRWQRRWTAVGR